MATETVPVVLDSASDVLSNHLDDAWDIEAMLAGARGLLTGNTDNESLARRLLLMASSQLAELRNEIDELGLSLSHAAREHAHG